MKKKFGFIWMTVFTAVAMTGCLDSSDNGENDKARPVEAGIYIYNATSTQNLMALQPVGIALRMAILRAEAAAQNKLDDLNMVFVPGGGNVKTLFFGVNTKITENEGTYEIAYAGAGGMAPYDSYARIGTVRVQTGGIALEDTDAASRWTVTLGSETLTVATGARDVNITSTGGTSIYHKDGGYEISFRSATAYIDKKIVSNWTGNFVWTPEKTGDLSFSALKGSSFGFSGSGAGSSFWTLNNTSPLNMSFEVSDGKYNPSLIGSTRIIGGTETARLTNPSDYDPAVYPSPEVKVTWTLKDQRLNYLVEYNGNSVEFTY